jgi:hypothetical protein
MRGRVSGAQRGERGLGEPLGQAATEHAFARSPGGPALAGDHKPAPPPARVQAAEKRLERGARLMLRHAVEVEAAVDLDPPATHPLFT